MFVASNSLNEKALAYLHNRSQTAELIAAPDSVSDPYMSQGSHPDVVDYVWNKLGKALPLDCRCLVYGTPALVQPATGILLAFCLGTQYGLRLLPHRMDDALKLGAKTSTTWAGGTTTNTFQAFGADWIFGGWKSAELDWCSETFETYSKPFEVK